MKKIVVYTLSLALACSAAPLCADQLDNLQKEDDALWKTGGGAQDGGTSALGLSMLGWGIGLGLGLGILAAVLHQSKASSAHSSHCD